MVNEKLARVRWEMGQTLLPEHLLAQEASLSAESELRFRTRGLPAYGVADLVWSDTLLWEGVLSVEKLTLILPSGTLLDVPGNADLMPTQLHIAPGSGNQTADDPAVQVFCQILEELSGTAKAADEWIADARAIPRRRFKLILGLTDQLPAPFEPLLTTHALVDVMKLAAFEPLQRGGWQVSEGYIPPLLQIGSPPFLQTSLHELTQLLNRFQSKLRQEYTLQQLTAAQSYAIKQGLKSVQQILRLLTNLQADTDVRLHPYYLYEALQTLYADLCIYWDQLPDAPPMPYQHQDLQGCFQAILGLLTEQLQARQEPCLQWEFQLQDGVYRVELPDFPSTRDAYFVVANAQGNEGREYELPKLGSHPRLHTIHEFVLNGITLKKQPHVPAGYRFDADVTCYQLVPDEEWAHACQDGSLAFYAQPQYEGLSFYLL